MFKQFIAAGLLAAGIGFGAGVADAKTKIDIGVGIGLPSYGNCHEGYNCDYDGPRHRYRDRRHVYEYPDYDDGYDQPRHHYKLSCRAAKRKLRHQGWRGVEARECRGDTYTFVGWRRGDRFFIKVHGRSGAVIGVRRI